MKCSIIFLCSLSLLEADTPITMQGADTSIITQGPIITLGPITMVRADPPISMAASLSISLNGKLIASTLQAKTIYRSVKDDYNLLDAVLKLSENPLTAVGVKRYVEKASEHAEDVANICFGMKNVLIEAEIATWSAQALKQACDSREELSDALDYWRENEDFIRTNIPTAVEYIATYSKPAIESCVSDLSEIPICNMVS
jgi:hypothetical protein